MNARQFQSRLLQAIEKQLPEGSSMADVLSDLLGISRDSAYRRLRNETAMSFDEAVILSKEFRLSLSAISDNKTSALFLRNPGIHDLKDYREHMQGVLQQLQNIQSKPDHCLIYSAKDIPIFYQFAFPRLAAFKMYVWLKSLYDIQRLEDKNYDLNMIPSDLIELAGEQWKVFSRINSVEIWNDTTITSLLQQIEYYFEAGLLRNKEEALELCSDCSEMLKIIYQQAVSGEKTHAYNLKGKSGAQYKMFYHEVLIMDNHILAELSEEQGVYFVPYAGINLMFTSDPELCRDIKSYLEQQMKKSALISDVSEKERNKFFLKIRNQITALENRIKNFAE